MFIWNHSIQDSILYRTFQTTDFAAGLQIENFHNFKIDFESSNDFKIDREFPISESAIKKQQRSYRRAINLDKKIQIIITGNSDCVEKGLDSRGKFYKIYYNNEE